MNPLPQPFLDPRDTVRVLVVYLKRWLIPTVILGGLALGYALVRPATWEASQALIIRNEAVNNQLGPGKFGHTDEMKAVQETILELVKSRAVLRAAFERIGPPAGYRKDETAWPTARDVAKLRKRIKLTPPNGAEFGKTEVFYLQVQDHDRTRAIALNRAVCDQLLARFQQLRDAKAQSMIDELIKTVHLAKADLDTSTARLTATETQVGSDLAELRSLGESGAGDTAIGRTIEEIRAELRQIGAARKANRQLLVLLEEAGEDPGRLVAMPNRLLQSQPALRRLKEGLVDAQLQTAALQGTRSEEHPLVQAAKESEKEIGRHLHNELALATGGLKAELQISADRETMLKQQLAAATGRLGKLARLRATYVNQVAEARHRALLVERAEQNLAEARATHASAKASSLISRIDAPDAGIYPIGASRSMIVLIGIAGGLLTGFGILFLTLPSTPPAAAVTRPTNGAASSLPPRTAASEPLEPVLDPAGNLSFKQALQRIAYRFPEVRGQGSGVRGQEPRARSQE